MGYYSEVGLALTCNGATELYSRLASMPSNSAIRKEVLGLFDYADQHYVDKKMKAEVWFWNNIKWYDNDPDYYPEIYFIEKVLEELDDADYRLIRIGEDYDDTEVRGSFTENPFDLELTRGITIQAA